MTSDEIHRTRYADAIREACLRGEDAFQDWFNSAESADAALRAGYWDFAVHVLTPAVVEHLPEPSSATALEIGYGGGRLLNAAATFFGRAIGVDIHGDESAVRAFLDRQGRTNAELVTTPGDVLPVEAASVDLVYSFIVLQHLPRREVLVRYLAETFRVLRAGGVAQLYYGRLQSRNPFERYRESDVEANQVSLALGPRHMRRISRDAGFRVVARGTSYRNVPAGYRRERGVQGFVTLLKQP
jgi:SAM-dependent methyltransferase